MLTGVSIHTAVSFSRLEAFSQPGNELFFAALAWINFGTILAHSRLDSEVFLYRHKIIKSFYKPANKQHYFMNPVIKVKPQLLKAQKVSTPTHALCQILLS